MVHIESKLDILNPLAFNVSKAEKLFFSLNLPVTSANESVKISSVADTSFIKQGFLRSYSTLKILQ